jgi:Ca2+-binding RTX toxin-like protein
MATIGTNNNDTLVGTAGTDFIYGYAGNDVIYGGLGDDWIYGGEGADYMVGGSGADHYYIDSPYDVVVEDAIELTNPTRDTVYTPFDYYGLANIERAWLIGTANTNLTVATVAVAGLTYDFYGNAGNNIMTGGDGHENMSGFDGNDTLIGNGNSDFLSGDAGEDILYGGTGDDFLLGETGNDILYGGADHDLIYGGTGSDYAYGEAGADQILGQDGNDFIFGGDGVDTLVGGEGDDYVEGGSGIDYVYGGNGFDTLVYSASGAAVNVNLATNAASGGDAEGDIIGDFECVLGSQFNDVIVGSADGNVLNGGAGADYMQGGSGNDGYVVDNVYDDVYEVAGATDGWDYIWSTVSLTNAANVEALYLGGVANLNAFGLATQGDYLYGNAGNNKLLGMGGDDLLFGGAGNDRLNGGAGRDSLQGDAGKDVFDFNTIGQSGKTAGTCDVILDFVHLVDNIDVASIDAKFGTVGNDGFRYIGGASFSAEGQIRAVQVGADTLLEFNTRGLSGAEMTILLHDHNLSADGLSATDFIL